MNAMDAMDDAGALLRPLPIRGAAASCSGGGRMNQLDRPNVLPGLAPWHFRAVAAFLVLTFLTGGGSYDRGLGDVLAQLLAVPMLLWALWVARRSNDRRVWWALATAGLVLAIVSIQCVQLPVSVWHGNPARAALLADLSRAGVDPRSLHWSLTPAATERGLWSLFPALALFASALSLDRGQRRWTATLMITLAFASVVLGYVQAGVPQDSLLNVFPEWVPAFNGVFASPNHQATAIGVALVMTLALLLEPRHGWPDYKVARWPRFTLGAAGIFLLAALPLTGSRAMAILAILGLLSVAMLSGAISRATHATGRIRVLAWTGLSVSMLLGLVAALAGLQWVVVDAREEVRVALSIAGGKMGWQLSPWGGGVGSFVPWFDQFAPDRLFAWEYYNHAHNEYVQWWMESGWLGLLAVVAALAWLAWSRPSTTDRAGAKPAGEGSAVGAWVGILVVLAHSGVDYPLRTPAMLGVAATLAGIALAAAVARSASASALNSPSPCI